MAGASNAADSDGPCPTENILAAQCAGSLSGDEAARIGAHIDTCEACREVMIALRARPSSDPLATTRPDDVAETLNPKAPALPTTLLERYQIKRELGSGGMGVVYEAVDLNLHRVVALKVLRTLGDTTINRTEAANRLVREARAMAVLSHRHVVTVYDVGVQEGQVFIAMQLVDGATLRAWTKAQPRTVSQILRVVCDAGSGLAAAHAAGLIHRDFKPDNVLVSKRGTARVTDFGLARRAEIETWVRTEERDSHPKVDIPDAAGVTRSGAVLGTPAYMAPEQTGGKPIDARADQFSFCVTAWEALFGVRPFAGTSWSEIYANVVAGTIVGGDATGVPRLIQRALKRGMAADPDKRFVQMLDLLEVLETGVAKPMPWKKFAAIAAGSAAVAGATVWIATSRFGVAQEPEHAPVVASRPTVTPIAATPAPTPPAPAPEPPPPVATPAPTPPAPAHKRHVDAPATPAPQPAVVAPQPTPLDDARTQRAALDADMRKRSLHAADLDESTQAALVRADAAIAAGDDHALAQVTTARTAIAAVVIDRAFIDRKLNRINRTLHGSSEELKPVYKQLHALVDAAKFADANALLDRTAEQFGR